MKLPDHRPLKGKKFQFVGWVMGLSLGQGPANIGDDGISPIIMCLVEDSPQARPTCIGMQLEGSGKVGIDQNRHCVTLALQFIKGLLASGIPSDGCPLCTCIFTRHQVMQRLGYLHEFWDELVIVPSECQEAPDLSDSGRDGPHFDNTYFFFVSFYTLGRDVVPQVYDLSVEELTF